MTANTMRDFVDEVKQLCKDFSDLRDRPYMGDVVAALDSLYEQWQAAQSVPVMGEPVAWLISSPPRHVNLSKSTEVGLNGATQEPLYLAPANSIPAAELEALRKDAVAEWQPIETAPKDGRMALVYRPLAHMSNDYNVAIKRLVPENNTCWNCTVPDGEKPYNPTDGACHVTHWMPLPAAPATKEEK